MTFPHYQLVAEAGELHAQLVWLGWNVAYALLCATCVLYAVYCARVAWARLRNAPPLVTGLLPWVGCVPELSRRLPFPFVQACAARYGDCFTMHAAGQYLTFVLDPAHFDMFFTDSSGRISFTEATLPFLARGFGVTPDSYVRNHSSVLDAVRGHLAPKTLAESYCTRVRDNFVDILFQHWGDAGEARLMESVRHGIFWGSTRALFDEAVLEHPGLARDLHEFDSNFELAASALPHVFLPAFTRAKTALRAKLTAVMANRAHPERTSLAAEVLEAYEDSRQQGEAGKGGREDGVGDESRSAWLLSVLWAAEANSIPCTFWTLTYLLMDGQLYDRAVAEVAAFRESGREMTYKNLQAGLPLLRRCVHEAIRLKSPVTIVRKTVKPVPLGGTGMVVPAGHMLVLSPAIFHTNDEVFVRASEFNPDRWNDDLSLRTLLPKTPPKWNFIAFGGGPWRCPGKYLAEMEIVLFVYCLLERYDLELLEAQPGPKLDQLVGIQQPAKDVHVSYRRARRTTTHA